MTFHRTGYNEPDEGYTTPATTEELLTRAVESLERPLAESQPWWENDPEAIADDILTTEPGQALARRDAIGAAMERLLASDAIDPDQGIRIHLPDAEDDDYLVTLSDDVGGYGKTLPAAIAAALGTKP